MNPTGLWVSGQPPKCWRLPTYPQPLYYDDGQDGAALIGVGPFSNIKWAVFDYHCAALMPQVGPFSIIKWSRFRLTKTQDGQDGQEYT